MNELWTRKNSYWKCSCGVSVNSGEWHNCYANPKTLPPTATGEQMHAAAQQGQGRATTAPKKY